MTVSEKAREITKWLYWHYGSDTGYLLGIHPERRGSVETIVQKVMDYLEEDENESQADKD